MTDEHYAKWSGKQMDNSGPIIDVSAAYRQRIASAQEYLKQALEAGDYLSASNGIDSAMGWLREARVLARVTFIRE